jgi:flavorubredoxin
MTLTPDTRPGPYEVAPETFVIPSLFPAPPAGHLAINSIVIRGPEPILVDTGTPLAREEWLAETWSLVDPADVRWVFLSHDDGDHVGNLAVVAEACPQATFLASWLTFGHLGVGGAGLPPERCRIIADGETFTAGDRTLVAVRPPVYDSPGTRGLFDTSTGVLYASDCFGAFLSDGASFADELPVADWEDGMAALARLLIPWHTLVDGQRYQAGIDRLAGLRPVTITSCHGPVARGATVDRALALLRRLPAMPAWDEPTQADVERFMALLAGA